MMSIITSVKMFGTLARLKCAWMLLQLPGRLGFHAFAQGVHWNTSVKTLTMHATQSIAAVP